MKFEIKNRFSGELIIAVEAESWRFAVELAIKQGADLRSADLRSADLRHASLRYADLSYADLMLFQFQRHQAYYTFDGALRIGCMIMPVTEWALGFKEIGEREKYSEEQILMYGQLIAMCLEHFKRSNQ